MVHVYSGILFSHKKELNNANRHMKRYSTSSTRKKQIKTAKRCHLTTFRTCIIKKQQITSIHFWWEYKLVEPLWKTYSMEILQRIKNWASIWSSTLIFAYLPNENKNTNWKRYVYPDIHCSTIYNSQDVEAT